MDIDLVCSGFARRLLPARRWTLYSTLPSTALVLGVWCSSAPFCFFFPPQFSVLYLPSIKVHLKAFLTILPPSLPLLFSFTSSRLFSGLLWSEVTPENLLLLDADGNILEGTGEAEITATMVLY